MKKEDLRRLLECFGISLNDEELTVLYKYKIKGRNETEITEHETNYDVKHPAYKKAREKIQGLFDILDNGNDNERKKGFGGKEKFLDWYLDYNIEQNEGKIKCCYCGVEEKQLHKYFDNLPNGTKNSRGRGKKLEIERKDSTEDYSDGNCALACYVCNNAKSDFLNKENFRPIAEGINKFWSNVTGENIELGCIYKDKASEKK
jgi:hypothetical protein